MLRVFRLIAFLSISISVGASAQVVTYYYTDPQGSVLATTDATGNIREAEDYAPYGQGKAGSSQDGPGFTGHFSDAASALVYMQARYYDPEMGRFLSRDPVSAIPGNVFSMSGYAYANANPARFTDPTGRMVGLEHAPSGDFYRDSSGERHSCAHCLSSESKAAFGSNEVPLGSGYVGRHDNVPGTDLYEVHVYEDSNDFRKALRAGASDLDRFEVGIMGSRGEWMAKHGHDAAPVLSGEARNALRGYAAEMGRARGWLPIKGEVNIRGSRLAAAIEAGMQRTGSATFLRDVGRSLGPVAAGGLMFYQDSVQGACATGVPQAGGIGGDLHCDD